MGCQLAASGPISASPSADDAQHQQIGIVERSALRVHQGTTQLAALVDRARRLRRHMTRDPASNREVDEVRSHAILVLGNRGVNLALGPLKLGIGHQARAAVPGPGHILRVEVLLPDHPIHVGVEEVETRRGAQCRPGGG